MAWFRINETKYLCHCIKQLKKPASVLQTEKNVHSTKLFPAGNVAGAVGEERLSHLSGISRQRAAFPEQSFAASCLLPGSVDKWPLYVGLAVVARGERVSGLRVPGHPGHVGARARCLCRGGAWSVCVGCALWGARGCVSGFRRWEYCSQLQWGAG